MLDSIAINIAKIHHRIKYELNEEAVPKANSEKCTKNVDQINESMSTIESLSPLSNTSLAKVKVSKLSSYQKMILIFEKIGDIEESVMIVGLIYLLKILEAFQLEEPQFLKGMFATCVFLAHKFLIEDEYWPVDEFSKMVNISPL